MSKSNAVEDNKAFVATILALEVQIKNAEDAAFAAEHFANFHAANQFRRSSSTPSCAPALDEPLPPHLKALVGEYQAATESVLDKLIEHDGYDIAYEEVGCGQGKTEWMIRSLIYKDRENVDQAMSVSRKQVERCDGMGTKTLYIFGSQYMDLFLSMIKRRHIPRKELDDVLRQMVRQLDTAIAARQTVHDWHKLLPAADVRVKDNNGHEHFLNKLKSLRQAISRRLQGSE